MNAALFAAAISMVVQPTETDRRTAIRRKRGYDPGPIVNLDRLAIREAAAAERKVKHEAKMARRSAQKERGKKQPPPASLTDYTTQP